MWQRHLKRNSENAENAELAQTAAPPSTPKKLLGSLLDAGGAKSEALARLEEDIMTARMAEVEGQAELKQQRLKVMELETQNQVMANQLKRQSEETSRIKESLEAKIANESKLEQQLREAKRQYADLESRMKEDLMMARIRDAENIQCVAELTQKISSLEYKVIKYDFNFNRIIDHILKFRTKKSELKATWPLRWINRTKFENCKTKLPVSELR